MSAELAQPYTGDEHLHVINHEYEGLTPQMQEKVAPYIKNPEDIPIELLNTGFSLGQQSVFIDKFGRDHTTDVLDSYLYYVSSSEDGVVRAYFNQYTSYQSDGYGIYHPHEVPHQKLVSQNWRRYEDHTPRKIGMSNQTEARRILIVELDKDGDVNKQYIESRNLKFGFEDMRRLQEKYEEAHELLKRSQLTILQPNTNNISSISLKEGELSAVAD